MGRRSAVLRLGAGVPVICLRSLRRTFVSIGDAGSAGGRAGVPGNGNDARICARTNRRNVRFSFGSPARDWLPYKGRDAAVRICLYDDNVGACVETGSKEKARWPLFFFF